QNVRRELPVDSVSWYECQEFMRRLIQLMPALMWQLPSEAEWEYACRAGTTTPFSTGENITTAQANYDGNDPYAYFDKGECRETTVPVKSFAPNLWGLYQMHGNVSEWCDGPWRDKALAQQREAIEPADEKYPPQGVVQQVRSDEQTYVLRGGSWCSDGQDSRSAHRFDLRADDRGSFIGLRLSLGHELQGR
ncbi:MAG: formylglycine-generating enzyme family protein, partial [Pontibacterium sp.]